MTTVAQHLARLHAELGRALSFENFEAAAELADSITFAANAAGWDGPQTDWLDACARQRVRVETTEAARAAEAHYRNQHHEE